MTTPCQRWREHRESYRPAGEPIDTTRYGVELVEDCDARRFVVGHHYSASYVAARVAVGLFRSRAWIIPELVGVAVFSVPAGPAVLGRWFPGVEAVELGRLVLLDDVPANGESFFVARAFKALRKALPAVHGVLSFSDPVQRMSLDGRQISPGHIGIVYQATNGAHLGRSTSRTLILAPRQARGTLSFSALGWTASPMAPTHSIAPPPAGRLVAGALPASSAGTSTADQPPAAVRGNFPTRHSTSAGFASRKPMDRGSPAPTVAPSSLQGRQR